MVNVLKHSLQLKDLRTGKAIVEAGGAVVVCTAGTPDRATLYDPDDNSSLSQPVSFTRGKIEFDVADTVLTVDIYGITPNGHFFSYEGLEAGTLSEIAIDQGQRMQVMKVPWSHADSSANTETDTGFDLPTGAFMLSDGAGVLVVDEDDTETIEIGTDSGDSGDADGLIDGVSIATAGFVPGTLGDGANTKGALLEVDESSGDLVPEGHVSAGKSITYTTSAGTDTGSGFIILPYLLTGSI